MITFSKRPLSSNEKQAAIKKLPGLYKWVEQFVIMFTGMAFCLLIPLLVVDKFSPVSSAVQGVYCITIAVIALLATIVIKNRYGGLTNKRKIEEINTIEVEAVHVKTKHAVKRKDFEDFGVAFYIEVLHEGIPKTLYLWGQYLDELEYENLFPNTEFEFTRKKNNDEFIEFRTMGQYFKAEKTLPAFDKGVWKSGVYPVNGQLLDIAINEIR